MPPLDGGAKVMIKYEPSLSRKEVSDMVSGPRYTGRDEKSELGLVRGHGDPRCETQTFEES